MDRTRRGLLGLPFALALRNSVVSAMEQQTRSSISRPTCQCRKTMAPRVISRGWRCPTSNCVDFEPAREPVDDRRAAARALRLPDDRPPRPEELPQGWDEIPGARGCTPETCGFRDHHKDLAKLQAEVFGVSTQDTAYQQEMVKRLEVPFEVLSDEHFALTKALKLPTFTVEGMTLMKRLTLIVRNNKIEQFFYPVFRRQARGGSDRVVEGAPARVGALGWQWGPAEPKPSHRSSLPTTNRRERPSKVACVTCATPSA